MKKTLICLMVLGLIIGGSGFASAAVQKGDTTLTLDLAFTNTETDYGTFDQNLTARVALGRFLTDNFQLEGILSGVTGEMGDGALDYTYGALLVRPNFHFATETATVPYIGAAAGIFHIEMGSESETSFIWGGQVGLKQFIRDNVFLKMEASYLMTEVEGTDMDIFKILVGLGFKL